MREALDTALVRIRTRDGEVVGSGFLVGERQVLTCAHVIAQVLGFADDTGDPLSSQVQLDFPQLASHTLLLARVVFWLPVQSDSQGDIAGLELLDEPPAGAKPVHLAPADQVWGHPFRALGFPHGYDDGVWATGRLLGRQGTRLIQLEDIKIPGFPVMSGFSGAPVWDEQLQGVVGMIALASQAATTKTAFAIPSDVLVLSWPQLASFLLPSVPRNPYKGLDAFTQDDTRDFFGREALTKSLATVVEETLTHEHEREGSARLLAVLGASGSGKSSAVMAGLIPQLRAGNVTGSQDWVYLDPIIPGTDPLEAFLIALKPHFPDTSFHTLRQDLEENVPRGLHLLATQLVNKPGERAVLLIDQFEEIFTLTIDEAKRRRFFDLLVTAVTEPHGPLFVILTLRADLYDRPMQYPELYRLIDEHHVSVLPMGKGELRSAIEGPAHLPEVHLTFEGGLIEELLFAVEGQSGALPLLEFTLDQLVRHRDGQQLTLHAYHEMGEVKGALSQYAEEVYQRLPSNEHRETARDLFLRLIHPGITEQDTTRRRAWYVEFEQADSMQTLHMQEVMERFIRARLLTGSQVSGNRTIEVSHETLIREWKRLAAWLREARADILFQQSLSEDVAEWEQRERPRDRLYRGVQFKEAQGWASRNRPSKQEAVFLQASAHQRILSRVSLVVLACVLLSSLGGAGWFFAKQPPDPTLVTTLQDNMYGSLRYCVESAPTGSTIRFAQGLHGTIDLQESLSFPSGEHLTIQGPGASQLTISGAQNSDANIIVPPGATVTLAGLSFKNSQTLIYAFLLNSGTLTVKNSVISNNEASSESTVFGGAIFNLGGSLTVLNSILSGNTAFSSGGNSQGGGIDNQGTLMVVESTFSRNTAVSSNGISSGGGIDNQGVMTVSESTFSDNSSGGKQDGQGGGVDNEGKLTVARSTFSQNTAVSSSGHGYGGGITNHETATVTVSKSTFSQNTAVSSSSSSGGGIDNEGKLTVVGSIFSQNTAVGSNGNSLGGGLYNYTGTVTVSESTFSRNTAVNSNGNSFGGGICNQGAMTMSESTFSGNSSSGKQFGQGGGIDNQGKLTVVGSTFSQNTAVGSNGKSFGGGLYNYTTGTVTVSESTFSQNTAVSSNGNSLGGGIGNEGKLTVAKSTFSQNTAVSSSGKSFGGGIYNYTGTVTVSESTFSGNASSGKRTGQGGGIDNEGKLTVVGSTFSQNTAVGSNGKSFGGGLANFTTGTVTMSDSTFLGNASSGKQIGWGGGIDNEGKLTVVESTFSQNTAVGSNGSSCGGGICNEPGTDPIRISGSIIAANKAANGPDISGVLISDGYNLLTNIAGVTGLNTKTDKQVTIADLKLDTTLRNNGGPTQTLALLPGSPAIDAIPLQVCHVTFANAFGQTETITTDQRGDPRPDGSENACDIGAYESSSQG